MSNVMPTRVMPDRGDQFVRPIASERMIPAIQIHNVSRGSAIAMPRPETDRFDGRNRHDTKQYHGANDREIEHLDRHFVGRDARSRNFAMLSAST